MATEQEILSFRNTVEDIRREIGKEIIGQQDVVEHMIMALVAGGNVLLEGVPGLGKTRLVRTLSHVLDLPFSRIQFTPDLMPADITGTNIIVKTTQGNAFEFQPGPLFASIVLADESWHQGVVGIVASRMAEEYSCPTFLICLDGDKGKASSRSYGGFNLFRSLEQLSGLLESYGGHELAAGFTIRRESIAPFREKMMALCARFRESDACSTALAIDCEIPPELLTIENIQALGDLEPCGAGCPRPVLCMRGLHVTELAEVGGGKHLRLRLSKGTHTWGAIFFSTNAQRAAVAQGDVVDIAFTPQINEYRSVRSVQLNLVDIRPDKAFREAQGHDRAVYKKHLAGGALSCDEAGCLLPTRQDFAAVWRYLAAFSQDGVLSEELGCLSRKISRCAKLSLSAGKTRICLDVLAEQGLLQLEQRPKSLCIRLCANGRKVDLEKSPILIHLKKQKAGN